MAVAATDYFPSRGDFSLGTGDTADDTVTDATTNASTVIQNLTHLTTGTASAGMGAEVDLKAQNGSGTAVRAAVLRGVLSTVTNGAEVGALRLGVIAAGSVPAEAAEQLEVATTGITARVSLVLPLVTKTSAYPLTAVDYMCLADATSAAVTITLPAATGCSGRVYVIKRINVPGNNVTVASSGGTIDGATTVVLSAQWQSITVQSNGTNWFIC